MFTIYHLMKMLFGKKNNKRTNSKKPNTLNRKI